VEKRPTIVQMSPAAASALRQRGGNLYVWVVGIGVLKAGTEPPSGGSFDSIRGDDWIVHIDRSLQPTERLGISWTRLPWPHFKAIPNPASDPGAGLEPWYVIGELWDHL
jgi:hypothetical protein